MNISWEAVNQIIANNGWRLLIILIIALVVRRFGLKVISRFVRRSIKPDKFQSKAEEKQREDTIIEIIHAAYGGVVWTIAGLMVLAEFGISIAPILAGAGIAGVALGFGAQNFVRDIIDGFYIIIENQYKVGDVVALDGTMGEVEDVTLRITRLRDLDGILHHVPNGSFSVASNYSQDFSRVNLNVGVSYSLDLDQVIEVVNQTGMELTGGEGWKNKIINPPQFLRVEDFGDSAVIIKIVGDVKPLMQWEVSGELRKRLKQAFDENDIEIPYPQRVTHQA